MNLKKTWLPDETLMGIFDQPIAEVGRAKYIQRTRVGVFPMRPHSGDQLTQ